MALNQKKYEHKLTTVLRDVRPMGVRVADAMQKPSYSAITFIMIGALLHMYDWALAFGDLIMFFTLLYFLWLLSRDRSIAFKLPMSAKMKDKNNVGPGRSGKPEGILYLGNTDPTGEEVWFTNSDARTHVLYLGTTGSGKTEGLKSMVTNALTWGSGFVYVDGKADTDLWSSISSLVRRFGRDDDLLVLNYMTGNSDAIAPSNTMNPFSSGSASYLTNMLVSLMPEAEGDNAMWKERAVSLASAMMPALTYKRDKFDMPLSVRTIREYLSLPKVVKLSRDETVPETIREGLKGYLDTLPGFVHDAFDDNGQQKPPGPDTPQYDTTTSSQQHGYLAMQFTRALQSLGDDYGYIFDTQAADVDMVDVVLNRRILVVLIPALEKSGDEIANLGKIVAATLKGMMGSTLGSTVEGSSETVIENKPTHSSTPFMVVFDEVGYYTVQGMAVMAAQARSLGFSLVFSGQDLPAMKKRVREEANSITANCNIKIFGKLEDPTETKEFFEKTVGQAIVTEVSSYQSSGGSSSYFDTKQAGVKERGRASYDGLRALKEGMAVITFGDKVTDCQIFYSNPGHAKAMRVTRYMGLPQPDDELVKHAGAITELRDLMVNKTWTAERADVALETPAEIEALTRGFKIGKDAKASPVDCGIMSLVEVHGLTGPIESPAAPPKDTKTPAAPPLAAKKPEALTTADTPATPPASPLAKKPDAPSTPPAEEKSGAEKTAPMSFFSKGDGEKPEEKTPPKDDKAKSWDQIIEETGGTADKENTAPAQPPETPAAAPAATESKTPQTGTAKLPKELQDIIDKAAKDAGKTIFKDKDDIDAAK